VIATQLTQAMGFLRDLLNREEGQGMVEYGLIITLVALVAAAGLTPLGTALQTLFENIAESL
jgi:pilus assembly protein Flp/PilA